MKKISIIVLIVFILSNAAYGGVTKSDFRSLKFLTSEVEGSSLRPEMVFGKGRMRKEPVLGPEVMYQGVLHEVIAQSEEMIGGQLRQKVKLRPIAVNDSAMEFTIIGPSVSKLAPMDISAIDLKVLKRDVRKAIAVLKKEKQKPTMSVVSLMIGHSEKYLIYLLEQEKLMPEQLISWGIYRQEIVLWILEQNVRSAVVRLEERKQKPTMNAVSREMGRGTRFLNNLVRRNPKIAKQLKSWGVKKRRFYIKVLEIQVNQALARIEERKEVPHMEAVSLEMGRPGNYLSMLVMENKVKPVDLESWGVRKGHVIHIDAIETEVRAAVARLSEKNQKPSMRAVALEMGHSNQEYLYRLITEKHVTANDLKSWGVKKRPFDIRILEAEIRAAVEKLTKEDDAPYIGAVSQKIGHGKNYIRGLLSKKKITWEQLESWGVKKEQFDIKILEKKVRTAVAELKMLSQKRTMAAVSLKMGYWQGYLSVLLGDGSVEERELRSWGVVVRIKRFDGRALTNCARREL